MPTKRELLRNFGHPFFHRTYHIRQLFREFDEAHDFRAGTIQDTGIELAQRRAGGLGGEHAAEFLVEYKIDTAILEQMRRLCQIVLLYATFESLCHGTLTPETCDWDTVNEEWVKRPKENSKPKKKKNKEGKNFIIALLEEAERQGMKSDVLSCFSRNWRTVWFGLHL